MFFFFILSICTSAVSLQLPFLQLTDQDTCNAALYSQCLKTHGQIDNQFTNCSEVHQQALCAQMSHCTTGSRWGHCMAQAYRMRCPHWFNCGTPNECPPSCVGTTSCAWNCNTPACKAVATACGTSCSASCTPAMQNNGKCDPACNNWGCKWDNGDCLVQCAAGCRIDKQGDGICQKACDVKSCNYDDGDCKKSPPPPPPHKMKRCRCTSTAFSDRNCHHQVGNTTILNLPADTCRTVPGGGGSDKIDPNCTAAPVWSSDDCSGQPIYVFRADGKCNRVGTNNAWYRGECKSVTPPPPPPPTPRTPCNCTTKIFGDSHCRVKAGNTSSVLIPAIHKCHNFTSGGSTIGDPHCAKFPVYSTGGCDGKPLYNYNADGKCNQFGTSGVWYKGTCTGGKPINPPPPPGTCGCKFLYWEKPDFNCTRPTMKSISTYAGQCTHLRLSFKRTISVEISAKCGEFRVFNGSHCKGKTISGARQTNQCIPLSNGGSAVAACGP
eukprot:TRINITY_DN66393_c8_g6_i1.p1 TRINITY_DN66393_c8_g6~~TRINITY_DN66393_c8_g6_i1.p1  ORF type:complete len:494 (+),score=39.67 TRINITY_DN66393_c8_g6_i1:36-1517(+)